MAKCRGTTTIEGLEYGSKGIQEAQRLDPSKDAPSMQFVQRRTDAVLAGKELLLGSQVPAGVARIAAAVLESALHVVTTADWALLRRITADMGIANAKDDPTNPVPVSGWGSSVFSEENVQQLRAARERLHRKTSETAWSVGQRVQARTGSISSDEDLKAKYFDFFVELCDTMVPANDQHDFANAFAEHLGVASTDGASRTDLLQRLKQYLESDLPSDFRPDRKVSGGSEAKTRQQVRELFFGSSVVMSKL